MLYLGPTPLDRSLEPGIHWCAAREPDISVEQGMRGFCVDPRTGRFVAKMTGPPIATPEKPAAGMEKYRKSLKDEYSDLMGLGAEGVWTEVDRTVTYRKKNVTIRVQQPPEKIPQLKVVKVLLGRI